MQLFLIQQFKAQSMQVCMRESSSLKHVALGASCGRLNDILRPPPA